MKKWMTLTLAAALALALAACGGGGGGTMTEEEMLEAAETPNFAAMADALSDNPLNAEETYLGKIYQFDGIVGDIQSDRAVIRVINTPFSLTNTLSGGNLIDVDVTLPEEDIKALSRNETVNIVGELTHMDGGYQMGAAYLVDNEIEITGQVENFVISGSYHIMQIRVKQESPKGYSYCLYEYVAEPVTAFENIEETTIDGVTVREGDTVTIRGTAAYTQTTKQTAAKFVEYTLHFDLNSISSVTVA